MYGSGCLGSSQPMPLYLQVRLSPILLRNLPYVTLGPLCCNEEYLTHVKWHFCSARYQLTHTSPSCT